MTKQVIDAVNGTRLKENIETNAKFGEIMVEQGYGRTVLPGTNADRQCREYFVDQIKRAGLEVHVDRIGNIMGQYSPSSAEPNAAPITSGSHLDSVPQGGIFDGPLGVYGALEAIRAIDDSGYEVDRPINVISFTDEEGSRYGDSLIGSSVASGKLPVEEALAITDDFGETIEEGLDEIGFIGGGVIDASQWKSFLELHIEQGKRLETKGIPAGVVTEISGQTRCIIDIRGQIDHAGTTSMDERADAVASAGQLTTVVESIAREYANQRGTTVATIGKFETSPGEFNVIPGHVQLSLDVRDTDIEVINDIISQVESCLQKSEKERGVVTNIERLYTADPVLMAESCQDALVSAADAGDIGCCPLHSGAGHDALQIASVSDTGMLFVPSRDGVSHTPQEWTEWDDCTAGIKVLAGALAQLATD